MPIAQTLVLIVLCGLVLLVLVGWLVYLLIRQYGQVLLDQESLQERVAAIEGIHEDTSEGVHHLRTGPRHPRSANQPWPASGVLYGPVVLKDGTSFEVAIDPRLIDPISRGVVQQNFWFLHDFYLLLDLMKPGDIVLDVGGHIGTFSLAAAALGCRVVCIEAAPDNAALLVASVARNRFDRMNVIHAVATDHEGTVRFLPNGPWGTVSNTAVARSPSLIYGRKHTPATVRALAIDDLLGELGIDHVDFAKADIEGSEVAAIRGMTHLLARPDAPILLYESNGHALHFFGETPERLMTSMRTLGYSSYVLDKSDLVPVRPGEFQTQCVINCCAVKGQAPPLEGWQIAVARSPEETINQIISECHHPDEHHRAYIARALPAAAPDIRSDPRVVAAVESLRTDQSEAVRAATAWLQETSDLAASPCVGEREAPPPSDQFSWRQQVSGHAQVGRGKKE
jgi:FkbM family methyltransferase